MNETLYTEISILGYLTTRSTKNLIWFLVPFATTLNLELAVANSDSLPILIEPLFM
jgi:hypothetical protein